MSFRIPNVISPASPASSDAITEIDLPALTADESARYARIIAELRAEAREAARAYAHSYAAFSATCTLECPDCDGSGVVLIGCLHPDDLIEERCATCLGAGVIDLTEAVTQPLKWMHEGLKP